MEKSNLLQGKVAFITGGAQGIGKAVAKSFIKHGGKTILADCDQKNLEKKKNAYINAKNNLRNAPAQLENAEKEYMVLDKGENYYASYIEKKYENEGKNIIRNYLDQHVNPVYNDIQNKLDYYKSQDSYRNNVDYLYETYNNDLKKLRKESKKKPLIKGVLFYEIKAATYSPTNSSTICADRLNFSVRYGKR